MKYIFKNILKYILICILMIMPSLIFALDFIPFRIPGIDLTKINALVSSATYSTSLGGNTSDYYLNTSAETQTKSGYTIFNSSVTIPYLSGSQLSGGNLSLFSTTHDTKGKILFGNSAYDEVNNRLGIGLNNPAKSIQSIGAINSITSVDRGTNVEFVGTDAADLAAYPRAFFYGHSGSAITNFGLYAASGDSTGTTQTPMFIGGSTNANVKAANSKQFIHYLSTTYYKIGTLTAEGTSGYLDIHIGGAYNSTTDSILCLKANGNVGIGTGIPSTKLHISSGTLRLDGTNPTINLGGTIISTSTLSGYVSITDSPTWSGLHTFLSTTTMGNTVINGNTTLGGATDVVLGVEKVTNPTFTTDTGWTHNAQWTVGGGSASYTAGTPATDTLVQSVTLTSGVYYQLEITNTGTQSNYVDVVLTTDIPATLYLRLWPATVTANRSIHTFRSSTSGAQTLTITPTTLSGKSLTLVSIKPISTTSTAQVNIKNTAGNSGIEIRSGVDQLLNTSMGQNSGLRLTTGSENVLLGYNVGSTLMSGYENVLLGSNAGASMIAGYEAVFVGYNAGAAVTYGTFNTFVGAEAGELVTTGTGNSFFGFRSGNTTSSNSGNTGFGYYTLRTATGGLNTSGGYSAGELISSGVNNTTFGYYAGRAIGTGSGNVSIGCYAGSKQSNVSNKLLIDNQLRADAATELTNSIIYGVMAAAPANQTLIFNAKVGIGTSTTTYTLNVNGSVGTQSVAYTADTYTVGVTTPTATFIEFWATGFIKYISTGTANAWDWEQIYP